VRTARPHPFTEGALPCTGCQLFRSSSIIMGLPIVAVCRSRGRHPMSRDPVQVEEHQRHSNSHHGRKRRSRFRRLKRLRKLAPQVIAFIVVILASYFVLAVARQSVTLSRIGFRFSPLNRFASRWHQTGSADRCAATAGDRLARFTMPSHACGNRERHNRRPLPNPLYLGVNLDWRRDNLPYPP
jgi:hypothetical protein